MKLKKVVTAVGVVALGLGALSLTSHTASAAEVGTDSVTFSVTKAASAKWNSVLEAKFVPNNHRQNTILGPEYGGGGGYSNLGKGWTTSPYPYPH